MTFTLTVWKDETTPHYAFSIADPNSDPGWLSKSTSRSMVKPLLDNIRSKGHVWFMKPMTETTMLMVNLHLIREKLPHVSLDHWYSRNYVESLRFENAVIEKMDAFTVNEEFREPGDPGMYHSVFMKADKVDWYSFARANRHEQYIEQWRKS